MIISYTYDLGGGTGYTCSTASIRQTCSGKMEKNNKTIRLLAGVEVMSIPLTFLLSTTIGIEWNL